MIDQTKKLALIEHIRMRDRPSQPEILLAPELYFDGYDHPHCTICANTGEFSTTLFAEQLRGVRRRLDVADVFVRFYSYEDAIEFEDSWITSDTVYVVTSATPEAARDWFAEFCPSDAWEEQELARFPDVSPLPPGHRLIAIWWD